MTPDNRGPDPTMPEPEALARINIDRKLEAVPPDIKAQSHIYVDVLSVWRWINWRATL
jgi:hypothetical protein